MAKLRVGDIVKARAAGLYPYTNEKRNAKIESIDTNGTMYVKLLAGENRGPWAVDIANFVRVAPKKKAQTIGQFLKAIVVDNSTYADKFQTGQIVILDRKSVAATYEGETLIEVVGSSWGANLIQRFAIDPTLKVTKAEVKEAIHG